ncbi:MAG TPA: cupin domain-containing protein [Candidatus Limnocylindria bacterium]
MKIQRPNERRPEAGDPAHFTGRAWLSGMLAPEAPDHMNVVEVTFEPGARSDWHTHPGGQVLLPLSGRGRIRSEGGRLERMQVGDALWIPAGERHWHGADPDSFLVQLSVTIGADGTAWDDERVTDEEYLGTAQPAGD